MREVIRYIVTKAYRPFLVKYLAGTRHYSYKGIKLEVPSDVFHPGFFFSTKFLLRYLDQLIVENKSFLEQGGGSGLISIYMARKGAKVTVSDINPSAVAAMKKNKFVNEAEIEIVQSDLFDHLRAQQFDIVAVNPPYYKKDPVSDKDRAWYCGLQGEYFEKFFTQLGSYIHVQTEVYMVLCDACDMKMIETFANNNGFNMSLAARKKYVTEDNFIYKISMKDH